MRKTVVITGGSKGIGLATARLFSNSGYNVAIFYNTSKQQADLAVEQMNEKGGNATAYKVDVTSTSEIETAFEQIYKKYRKIDVLVCSAGAAQNEMLIDVSPEKMQSVMSVNLNGVVNCNKTVLRYMLDRKQGAIVNVSSILGVFGCSCESIYSMTKGGILAFTKSVAKEYGASNIRANCVCPGLIDTDMNSNLTKEDKEKLVKDCLIQRIGRAEDVAQAILFLAEAEYVTATELIVSGGLQI